MRSATLALLCALGAVVLSACGSSAKPLAGTISPTATTAGHARIDDPRAPHTACLRGLKLPFSELGLTGIQFAPTGSGPTVQYLSTEGAAQAAQIEGRAQGAEVIGAALLYPNGASDTELTGIEDCLSQGVKY